MLCRFGDERDEINAGFNTRTLVMELSDLENPTVTGSHLAAAKAIDHNQYIMGQYTYQVGFNGVSDSLSQPQQANYQAGLRILEIADPSSATLVERASFDVFPSGDNSRFNGAWSTFPYLPSGVILLSVIEQGLFVLQWNQDGISRQSNAQCLGNTPAPAPTSNNDDNDKSCKFDFFFVICFVKKILFAIFDFLTFWD